MSKALITIGGILAALSLSACASVTEQAEDAPTATATPSGPSQLDEMLADAREGKPSSEQAEQEARLFESLEEERGETFSSQDKEATLGAAQSVCDVLDIGVNPGAVLEVGRDSGLTEMESIILMAGATVLYCPEHESTILGETQTPDVPEFNDDDEFIYDIEQELPNWRDGGNRSDLINLGNVICESLDTGAPVEGVLGTMSGGVTVTDVFDSAVILAAAVVNYCPEYEDLFSY